MEKPPAFQLYARDIYTGCSDMFGDEFGAYMRGLCWSWDNGPLPLDRARRANLMLVQQADFDRIWAIVGPNWQETPQGYVNARLEAQRAELEEYRRKCAEAGKKSGESRRNKRTDLPTDVRTDVHTDVATTLVASFEHGSEPPMNTPDSRLLSPSGKAKRSRVKRADPVPLEGFDEFWLAYPLKVAKEDAIKAWNEIAPNAALREFIGAALIWQRPNLTFEKNGQIRGKYPAAWLRGKRWTDERPPTAKPAHMPFQPTDYDRDAWKAECAQVHDPMCPDVGKHRYRMKALAS